MCKEKSSVVRLTPSSARAVCGARNRRMSRCCQTEPIWFMYPPQHTLSEQITGIKDYTRDIVEVDWWMTQLNPWSLLNLTVKRMYPFWNEDTARRFMVPMWWTCRNKNIFVPAAINQTNKVVQILWKQYLFIIILFLRFRLWLLWYFVCLKMDASLSYATQNLPWPMYK